MKYLRKRPRIDNLDKQTRAGSGWVGRLVYLTLLTAFIASIAYYLIGGMFVLSADGIVVGERQVVAAKYPATVVKVLVRAGDNVKEGAPLVQLESFDMVKEIADLSIRNSELAVRESELRGKTATIASILPLAERTAKENRTAVANIDSARAKGVIPAQRRGEAMTANFEAAQNLADLVAQAHVNDAELKVVEETRLLAEKSVNKMKAIYDDGTMRAALAGIVSSNVPLPGQVVRLGDELMQVYSGKYAIIAYLPDQYLFPLTEGTKVWVSGGNASSAATVEKVLQIADALPAEFQNMLRPRDRSRLIRIVLPEDHIFALTQKVVIRGCMFGWCWVR